MKTWYKADPSFKESNLSKVSTENIAILKYRSRACIARPTYTSTRNGAVQFEEDLDGDGKKDRIKLDGSTLTVNGKSRKLPGGPFDKAAIVDVKHGEKRKEMAVRSDAIEDDYDWAIATYVSGTIATSTEMFQKYDLRFPGDGRLVELSSNCGQRYWR